RDSGREQRLPAEGGTERHACASRRGGTGRGRLPDAGAREDETDADGRVLPEARRQRGLLRRREEAQRDPADAGAGTEAVHPGRDRLRPRHRRAQGGLAGRERVARCRSRHRHDHALPATAELRRAQLRGCALPGPQLQVRRQVARAETGGAWLRVGGAGSGGMYDMASIPSVGEFRQVEGHLRGGAWVTKLREAALARIGEQGFPTRRNEHWKYTDVSALLKADFIPAPLASMPEAFFQGVQRFELDC